MDWVVVCLGISLPGQAGRRSGEKVSHRKIDSKEYGQVVWATSDFEKGATANVRWRLKRGVV